jgi:hypothetical protein
MDKPKSHHVIKRLIPPLTVWAVGKLLETKEVRGALQDVDSRAYVKKRHVAKSVRRASKNAADNAGWLAAGVAAIAVGIGLMAKATRKK